MAYSTIITLYLLGSRVTFELINLPTSVVFLNSLFEPALTSQLFDHVIDDESFPKYRYVMFLP